MTTMGGAIVTTRRIQIGILRWRKPCMMTWPAIVPTVEEDRPEASREMAKTALAADPSRGVRVR